MENNVSQNPSVNPVANKTVLPSPPQTPEDDIAFRMEAFGAMNLAMYHKDMGNAGGDKFLETIAQQNFVLNQAKIQSWQRNIETKFHLIQQDENIDEEERGLLRTRIIDKAGDPINIPTVSKTQAQDVFSPDYIQKGLGTVMSNLNDGAYLDRNQVLYGNGEQPGLITIFGPDAPSKFPDFMRSVDAHFTSPQEEAAKNVLPSDKQIAEYRRLGGSQSTEGRKYARDFLEKKLPDQQVTKEIPPKPAEYPAAVWSDKHQMWTVIKDGKLVGLKVQ